MPATSGGAVARIFLFFTTRLYSANSNVFLFLSNTGQLPSFFSVRAFTSRYGVVGLRFRRFGLQLPVTLSKLRPLHLLLHTRRRGYRFGSRATSARRNSRFFFLRRKVASAVGRVLRLSASGTSLPRTLVSPVRAPLTTRS